ncbi:primosomal protein I [Salmonella enterica subsp. enterica serovar Namur str. 05-2929]|uniref:DnaT-like ssDNA-binding domain-containing protein n=1 Tax=Salmonella enterica TaxID=28901 RepID=UPI00043657C3|nr:DnaT-like ssDNA-binding domain-containing protein [Salmonella enterica]EXX82080.1 primosomal protein I [Salmonella enterica subsp. enterica serovar Namur str. 05-2929]
MSTRIFEIVQGMSGQGNSITIPCPYLDFFAGDQQAHLLAAILNQLVFWSGKSELSDGWFYKSYESIAREIHAVTKDQVRKAINKLETQYLPDIIETSTRKVNGAPTRHYRIHGDELIARLFPPALEVAKLPHGNGNNATTMEVAKLPHGSGKAAVSFLYTDLKTTDLNPTHNAGEEQIGTGNENLIPDYPGQPGMLTTAAQMIGKFAMHPDWRPSDQFRAQAVLWGMPIREGINLTAELNNFIAYWQAEGKVFHQVQWEQKFARHLQRAPAAQQQRGNQHAAPESTANSAVQQIRAARAQRLRARGEGLEILGNDGGNLLQSLDQQKRGGTVGPMDCSDWEFDQRPDDERV